MDFDGQSLPWRILVGLLNKIQQNQRNLGEEQKYQRRGYREPRMGYLPLLKPPIIYAYHIYKLVGARNGL